MRQELMRHGLMPMGNAPRFLAVRVGDLVAVQTSPDLACADPIGADPAADWWLGQVIHAEGGARCSANSLFQIACVDTGVIRTVNADAVLDILTPAGPCSGALEAAHDQSHQRQRSGQGNQQGDRHGG